MDHLSDTPSHLPRRRPVLRAVPAPGRYLSEAQSFRFPSTPEPDGLGETLRKLWRHRGLILACTFVLGGAAIFAAWSMPSYYVSEAGVLVGVSAPRVLNVEAVLADVSPDAERVQNEGFVLQSRAIALQVIDQLKLRDNPEFNPALRKPSTASPTTPSKLPS